MSSLGVRRRARTWSNRSASETNLVVAFRRRSLQSINTFSLRRILRAEPPGPTSRSTTNHVANPIASTGSTSLPISDGPRRRTNRGDFVIPQPFSSSRRAHQDYRIIPNPAITIIHPTHDFNTSYSPPPQLRQHHRELASTNTVENISGFLSPPTPLTSLLTPLFTRQLHHPPGMGNRMSSRSHHGPRQGNVSPAVNGEPDRSTLRPASSPAPSASNHSLLLPRVVIPDRRSSITPQPGQNPTNISPARTIRQEDLLPPLRASTAPGTKHSHENRPSQPMQASEASPPSTQDSEAMKFGVRTSNIFSPRPQGTLFPRVLTLELDKPTHAPPLTKVHRQCYHSHRPVKPSPNVKCPVPCMTCGVEGGKVRWKCQWCCLRICPECMERLSKIKGRDVKILEEKLKKEGRTFLGEWGDGNGRIWNDEDEGKGGRVSMRSEMKGRKDDKKKSYTAPVTFGLVAERLKKVTAAAGVGGVALNGQGEENENHKQRDGGAQTGAEGKR